MNDPPNREIVVFNTALQLPAAQRAAYLDEVCNGDVGLRRRVEALLQAHTRAGAFLEEPPTGAPSSLRAVNPHEPGAAVSLSSALAETAGDRIGRYKLLQKIGEGGWGVVYMAEQEEPVHRRVALKIIKLGMDTKSVIARFEAERQALAMMDHPNISKVLDAGATEMGRPFFVMELVRGVKITDYCDQNNLPTRARLDLFILVCQAVQHAHQKGIIHRDLKPSNILVTVNDGVAVPKVIDFGIAKATQGRLTNQTLFTAFEQFIGTPAYMSPEQSALTSVDIDTRSDIYSLGVLLYELLTGQTPFNQEELLAEGLEQMRRTICEKEPVRPSTRLRTMVAADLKTVAKQRQSEPPKLIHLVHGDLDWIVMKCLEKDRARRYETVNGLAMDGQRFLANEPIVARPPSQLYRLRKFARRNRLAFGAVGGVVAALVIGLGLSTWQFIEKSKAEREQRRLRERAEAAEQQREQQLYTALLEQARATVLTGEVGHRVRALEAVRRAGAISNSAALRGAAISALALPDLRFEREWPTTSDTTLANFDPAFERIALCRVGGPVEIRSVTDQRLLVTLPTSTNLSAFVGPWSPDGRFFAVSRDHDAAASVRDVEIWEVASAKQVLLVRGSPWGAMSFHPRLPRVMIGRAPATAVTWNLDTGEELTRHPLEGRPVVLKFAPDGERFVTLFQSAEGWVVALHHSGDGTASMRHVFADRVRELEWHPSGRGIAVPDFSGAVHWMDAQSGETRVLGQHKAAAVRTFFSPDGEYLFSSGWDRQLICWDVRAMRRAFTVGLESYSVQFRADGNQCAIFRWPDVSSQLHRFERPTLHREFAEDLGGGRNHAAFSPDGRWLAASGSQRLVVWDLHGKGSGAVLNQAGETRLRFAANGELFADRRGDCFRWRVKTGTNGAAPVLEPLELAKPAGLVSLCLVSNGVVFTGARGSRLAGFDQFASEQGDWKRTADGLNDASPDGRWLGMFRSFTTHFYVYQLPGFELVAKLTNGASIGRFEFSPRGEEVAVSTRRGIEFWITTTWQRTRHLTNFTSLLYSPDARTFWLSTDFRTAGLHDARTAESLLPLPLGTLPLALSPDGRHLAVSVDSRRVQVWDLAEVRLRLRELGLDWKDQAVIKSEIRNQKSETNPNTEN